jgi:hypothetical protein
MIDTCDPRIAGWSDDGETFVVKDPTVFEQSIIPQFFKHSKFSSFVRVSTHGNSVAELLILWQRARRGFASCSNSSRLRFTCRVFFLPLDFAATQLLQLPKGQVP